ncbi:MAG: hypothetical protein AVDCRST_MAG73-210, partial [uncultured Thermomicrobiales bacterium]
ATAFAPWPCRPCAPDRFRRQRAADADAQRRGLRRGRPRGLRSSALARRLPALAGLRRPAPRRDPLGARPPPRASPQPGGRARLAGGGSRRPPRRRALRRGLPPGGRLQGAGGRGHGRCRGVGRGFAPGPAVPATAAANGSRRSLAWSASI